MKKMMCAILSCVMISATLFTGCALQEQKAGNVSLDPANPTTVTVWHYYNGVQQEAFNNLVDEFNETAGRDLGIIVEGYSQGNVTDLENSVLDAVNHKVGAGSLPSIFAAYADTAYTVDKLGLVVDLSPYLTQQEKDSFLQSYLDEGTFATDDIKIFPIAKSMEIFILNKTDWDKFSGATGADKADLATFEGVTRTAKAYYEWTDSLTETPNDGRAFFGRDAMANYFIIGTKQLGKEIFAVDQGVAALNLDKDIMKKLWDNYYIPYIMGYFSATGRFRSDDIKTGEIISFIGSSSGSKFFPNEVILNDEESYPIEMEVLPAPQFEGGEKFAVQQGAGMVVTKTNDKEILASVEFLKWFVGVDQNIEFSIRSGYLPVTDQANDIEKIKGQIEDDENADITLSVIKTAIDTVHDNTLYTTKAFENGTAARNILEYSMSDKAVADRKVVEENLSSGMTLEQAAASFTTQENFDAWYAEIEGQLQELVK